MDLSKIECLIQSILSLFNLLTQVTDTTVFSYIFTRIKIEFGKEEWAVQKFSVVLKRISIKNILCPSFIKEQLER